MCTIDNGVLGEHTVFFICTNCPGAKGLCLLEIKTRPDKLFGKLFTPASASYRTCTDCKRPQAKGAVVVVNGWRSLSMSGWAGYCSHRQVRQNNALHKYRPNTNGITWNKGAFPVEMRVNTSSCSAGIGLSFPPYESLYSLDDSPLRAFQ